MPDQAQDVSTRLREVFNDSGFPAILDPLAPTPNTVGRPAGPGGRRHAGGGRGRAVDPEGAGAVAESCARRMEGTGFVIGPGQGDDERPRRRRVEPGRCRVRRHDADRHRGALRRATVTWPCWTCPSCTAACRRCMFAADPAAAGIDAIVAGYPLDGPYTLTPGAGPGDDPAARAQHLLRRDRHPRGLHAARRGPAGQLRRPAAGAGRHGARGDLRGGDRRGGRRLRAHRRRGRAGRGGRSGGRPPASTEAAPRPDTRSVGDEPRVGELARRARRSSGSGPATPRPGSGPTPRTVDSVYQPVHCSRASTSAAGGVNRSASPTMCSTGAVIGVGQRLPVPVAVGAPAATGPPTAGVRPRRGPRPGSGSPAASWPSFR